MFSVSNPLSRNRNRGTSSEQQIQIGNYHHQGPAVRSFHQLKHVPPMNFSYLQQPQLPCNRSATEDHHQPPKKRHKGVAGAILSTALDAALFTSAIGYAAYQFWTGKRLEDDEEEGTLQLSPKSITTKSSHPHSLSSPPPPPYEPRQSDVPQAEPSNAARRARLRSNNSRRPMMTSLSQPAVVHEPINFVLRPPAPPLRSDRLTGPRRRTPEQEESLMADFVCSLDAYIPPSIDQSLQAEEEEEANEEGEDDAEMRAFKTQIRGLILEGQAALASRPRISDLPIQSPPPLHKSFSHSSSSSTSPPTTTANHHQQHHHHQLDDNIKLLQLALDKASSKPQSNWWER